MADSTFTAKGQALPEAKSDVLASSLRLDLLMGVLGMVFVGGLYLDGWAHAHGMVDKTFFTPWHAVLYSAYALSGESEQQTVSRRPPTSPLDKATDLQEHRTSYLVGIYPK